MVHADLNALKHCQVIDHALKADIIRQHAVVNLGVAVALEDGLTVPVLRDAERLSLFELSAALRDLAAKARAGRLPPDAYGGGTFIENQAMFKVSTQNADGSSFSGSGDSTIPTAFGNYAQIGIERNGLFFP